jgi:tetratricopeptide (TPR) repeat protein
MTDASLKRSARFAVLISGWIAAAAFADELTPTQRAEHEKTIRIYTTGVIPSNPKDARSYQIRGFAYSALGQYDLALEDYSSAIRFAPAFSDHYRDRAYVYEKLGQYDKALEDFNAAIHLSPQRAPYYTSRAWVGWQLKDYTLAGQDYYQAVVLDPRNASASNQLAWFLIHSPNELLRNERQAVQYAQRACDLAPSDVTYGKTLADAQAALKTRSGGK